MAIVIASPTQLTSGPGRFAQTGGAVHTRGLFNAVAKFGTFTFEGVVARPVSAGAGQKADRSPTRREHE
jgi:hypothetical protein